MAPIGFCLQTCVKICVSGMQNRAGNHLGFAMSGAPSWILFGFATFLTYMKHNNPIPSPSFHPHCISMWVLGGCMHVSIIYPSFSHENMSKNIHLGRDVPARHVDVITKLPGLGGLCLPSTTGRATSESQAFHPIIGMIYGNVLNGTPHRKHGKHMISGEDVPNKTNEMIVWSPNLCNIDQFIGVNPIHPGISTGEFCWIWWKQNGTDGISLAEWYYRKPCSFTPKYIYII